MYFFLPWRHQSVIRGRFSHFRQIQKVNNLHTTTARQLYYKSTYDDVKIPEDDLTEYVFHFKQGVHSKYGNKIAINDKEHQYTYNALKSSILKVAESLQVKYGVKKGDVVMLVMPNCAEYAIALHGVLKTGAIASPANPVYTPTEIAFQIEDSNATKVFVAESILDNVMEGNKKTGNQIKEIFVIGKDAKGQIPFESLLECSGSKFADVKINQKDICLLPYSSGTTGKPKGVVLSHFACVANNQQIGHKNIKSITNASRTIGVLPFYHIYGLQILLNHTLLNGAQITCIEKFDPIQFLEVIQKQKINVAHLVPPILVFLAKHPVVDKYDLSSLTSMFSGAAPLSKELTQLIYDRFPKMESLRQGYGLTETAPAACIDDVYNQYPGSAGVLIPNTELKIVSPEGKLQKAGEEGEILIRGPQLMNGYLNNPKATAETFDTEGYLKTGDIGYVEPDGVHLHITDRVKELIKVKGFQVPPAELEGHLLEHPSVADCCVIGIPDERLGEHPKAFLVLKEPDANVKEILDYTNSHVAEFKAILEAEVVDVIPKSPAGKILRRILRDQEKEKRAAKEHKQI